jgi:hypothetical protein
MNVNILIQGSMFCHYNRNAIVIVIGLRGQKLFLIAMPGQDPDLNQVGQTHNYYIDQETREGATCHCHRTPVLCSGKGFCLSLTIMPSVVNLER